MLKRLKQILDEMVSPCWILNLDRADLVEMLAVSSLIPQLTLTPGWFYSLGTLPTSSPSIPILQTLQGPLSTKTSSIPTEQNFIALITSTILILQCSFLKTRSDYSFTFILSVPILDIEGVVNISHLFWLPSS